MHGRVLALAAAGLLTSCPGDPGPPKAPAPAAWSPVASGSLTEVEARRRARGVAARDALASRLLAALAAAGAEGDAAAIEVCQVRAPQLAREVSAETGVRIGRTSLRLRNPANAPPSWAAPLLEERPEREVVARGPDGALGLLLPIRLAPQCVRCHGPSESLAPGVRAALADRYPTDQATGFAPGDLRGWFWVEVP